MTVARMRGTGKIYCVSYSNRAYHGSQNNITVVICISSVKHWLPSLKMPGLVHFLITYIGECVSNPKY